MKLRNLTKTASFIGAIALAGSTFVAAPAHAEGGELTPMEMFCFLTSNNGEELAGCLDPLPARQIGVIVIQPDDSDDNYKLRTR